MGKTLKILLIAGHGQGDPGACSMMSGAKYQEYQYTRELVTNLSKCFTNANADVEVYDFSKNCYKQNKAGTGPDFSQFDYVFEVHFNAKTYEDSLADGQFTGVGFYLHTGIKGVSVERRVLANIVGLGFKQWADGIFYVSNLLNCNIAYKKSVDYALLETAFIDDLDDMTWYNQNKEAVAQAIADGIIDGFGIRKQSTGAMPEEELIPGWQKDRQGWWYLFDDFTYPWDGWAEIDHRWFLFDEDGYMLTGLQHHKGKTFYLCEEKGSEEGALMETDDDGALIVWMTE